MHISSCFVRMPGTLSVICSILIWKTSWLIFNLNCMHGNLYMLLYVLNVGRNELASLRWMLQKPSLALSFENVVMALSQCDISCRVGAV